MATATTTRRRLEAEAAQGRRGEVAEREKRHAAERALADLRRAQLVDPHPENCPSVVLAEVWDPIAERLHGWFTDSEGLTDPTWMHWLRPLHPHRVEGGVLIVACPGRSMGWVRERFGRLVERAAEKPVRFVGCDHQTNQRRATWTT
jgi:hypothetical protein